MLGQIQHQHLALQTNHQTDCPSPCMKPSSQFSSCYAHLCVNHQAAAKVSAALKLVRQLISACSAKHQEQRTKQQGDAVGCYSNPQRSSLQDQLEDTVQRMKPYCAALGKWNGAGAWGKGSCKQFLKELGLLADSAANFFAAATEHLQQLHPITTDIDFRRKVETCHLWMDVVTISVAVQACLAPWPFGQLHSNSPSTTPSHPWWPGFFQCRFQHQPAAASAQSHPGSRVGQHRC